MESPFTVVTAYSDAFIFVLSFVVVCLTHPAMQHADKNITVISFFIFNILFFLFISKSES